jgi:hypothetical protein
MVILPFLNAVFDEISTVIRSFKLGLAIGAVSFVVPAFANCAVSEGTPLEIIIIANAVAMTMKSIVVFESFDLVLLLVAMLE